MPLRRCTPSVLAIFLVISLTACRIELGATPGGRIISESGSILCIGDTSCSPIDVTTTDFDETFIAVADPGFEFVGWRRKQRGFCGGSRDSCRLFTSGFSDNAGLLEFLESDELFFLEAIFQPQMADSGSGIGSASSCWNQELVTVGATIVASYNSDDGLGGSSDFSFDQRIEGGQSFNGQNALLSITNTESAGEFGSNSVTNAYFQLPASQRVRNLGAEVETTAPQATSSVNMFEPFQLRRFDLAAGESFTQRYTTTTTSTAAGQSFSDTVDIEEMITFDGIEGLTVPAGQFEACRFSLLVTTSAAGVSTTARSNEWYSVQTGILLKLTSGEATTELVAASINGTDI